MTLLNLALNVEYIIFGQHMYREFAVSNLCQNSEVVKRRMLR